MLKQDGLVSVSPVFHNLSGHPGKRQKEEGRIKKSKEESGSTFGCSSDFLLLNSLQNPALSLM
jgi:hypothetical protein